MTMPQFRAFLAMVMVVLLVGGGYLLWHDTHPAAKCVTGNGELSVCP